jgi:hypothetical protein
MQNIVFDKTDIEYMEPFVKEFKDDKSKLDYDSFKKNITYKMEKYLSKNTGEDLKECRCQLLGKETIIIYNSKDPKFNYIINTTTGEVKHYSSRCFENANWSWSSDVEFNTIINILNISRMRMSAHL